ncbi:alanine racemase, partial [Rhodopseudomonas sp. B29]|uniref:alanine racemase n=1 Tax=Rhodopseudomonas sp. B29 TaxID=95607 RepID=UPI0004CE11F7
MNMLSNATSAGAAALEHDNGASGDIVRAETPGVLTVDLDAIVANWRKLEKTAIPTEGPGVVKGNAYGCGAGPVTAALEQAGCK